MNKDEIYEFIIKIANGGKQGFPVSEEEIVKIFGTDILQVNSKDYKLTGAILFANPVENDS